MRLTKFISSIALVVIVIANSFAQTDTLRVFQYNLLNYGDNVNPTTYKDIRLKTILQYIQPDIFSANEIYNDVALHNNILSNVLGAGWDKGMFVNTNNQVQTNMLFWKKDKLGLLNQTTVSHLLRDIIAFRFYYKGVVASPTDSIFLTVIVAHLKAGSDTNSAKLRAQEVQTVTNYLSSQNKGGNYIFLGDFNLYENAEAAYQSMSNHTNAYARFYDPLNMSGLWHNNSIYAGLHTQSTRSSNLSDGGVSGGMDDRFDFIMISDHILNDSSGIKYIAGSYNTVGQDGLHFNKSINDLPTNTTAPAGVIQALYEMSDHLPVYADVLITPAAPNSIVEYSKQSTSFVSITNPITDVITLFWDNRFTNKIADISVYSIDGRLFQREQNVIINNKQQIHLNKDMPSGMFLLHICVDGYSINKKIIKN